MITKNSKNLILVVVLVLIVCSWVLFNLFFNKKSLDTISGDTSNEEKVTFQNTENYPQKMFFDTGRSKSDNTVISPDNTTIARVYVDGRIIIDDLQSGQRTTIDILEGSTTVPGFSVPDYIKSMVNSKYPTRAYYYGTVAFLSNDIILYPAVSSYIMRNLVDNTETIIKGDVIELFESKYIIYTKDNRASGAPDNYYLLYNIATKEEVNFFPEAREDQATLSDFSICSDVLRFVQKFSHWPEGSSDFSYYTFEIASQKLSKINESQGEIPKGNVFDEGENCLR